MSRARDPEEIIALAVAAAVVIGTVGLAVRSARARAHGAMTSPEPVATLVTPHEADVLVLDGELDEPSWRDAARSGPFLTREGQQSTPYSDARFAWSKDALRIGLYAADEDIVAGDAFHVVLEVSGVAREIDVDPKCRLTGSWQSGARAACDSDGTIDVPGDSDEEWVVEMEVPLAKLGLRGVAGEHVVVSVRRCEVGASGPSPRPCGEMRATTLTLGP